MKFGRTFNLAVKNFFFIVPVIMFFATISHPAFGQSIDDCLECHESHASGQEVLLSQPLHALCGGCHDVEEEEFKKSHLYIEAALMECSSCHAPHASKDRNLFKKTMHSPFVKGNCEDCHLVGSE